MISYGIAYLLIGFLSLGSVSLIQTTALGSSLFGRLALGGTVGYSGSIILLSSETWIGYIDAAIYGFMGFGGYLFLFAQLGLIVVWGANLYTSGFKEVVR